MSGPVDREASDAATAAAPCLAGAVPDGREVRALQYGHMTYVLALQLTGRREDARDVSQEAMLRYFAHAHRLANRDDPKPWLITTVRNLVRDLWRRQRVRPTDSLDATALVDALQSPALGPDQAFEQRERRARLWAAIAGLPAAKREILVLRDFHDLSYNAIAGILGIPTGTVMSRLHAARAALRVAVARGTTHA